MRKSYSPWYRIWKQRGNCERKKGKGKIMAKLEIWKTEKT
jgi:hypothetical protein